MIMPYRTLAEILLRLLERHCGSVLGGEVANQDLNNEVR